MPDPTTDIVERLTDENFAGPMQHLRAWDESDALMTEAATTITALRARVEELEGVLEPFAVEADTWNGDTGCLGVTLSDVRRARAALRAKGGDRPHSDDLAVDRFAAAMKTKLAQKRAEGRGGWDDKDACSGEWLSRLLRGHVEKGDPVDVANFAMMLHQRGERIAP